MIIWNQQQRYFYRNQIFISPFVKRKDYNLSYFFIFLIIIFFSKCSIAKKRLLYFVILNY